MNKILLLLLICFISISCTPKRSAGPGERIDIFKPEDIITIGNKYKITVSDPIITTNYYGDTRSQDEVINNYLVNLNLLKDFKYKRRKLTSNIATTSNNPVIVNGIVYIVGNNGYLYAKNFNKPRKVYWKKRIFDKPTVKNLKSVKMFYRNGYIAISSNLNDIVMAHEDGKILWQKKINSVLISDPVIIDDSVYLISNDNKLYSFNIDTGKINFIHYGMSKNTAIVGTGNPVHYKNAIIVPYSSGELYSINIGNGETLWTNNLSNNKFVFSNFELTDINATPIIIDDIVYAVNNNGSIKAINANNGNTIWQKDFESIFDFVVNNETIYIIDNNNLLIAINTKAGDIQWTTNLNLPDTSDYPLYAKVTMINSQLVLTNSKKEFLVISPFDGKILRRSDISIIAMDEPIIMNGKLYLIYNSLFNTSITEFFNR